MISCNMAKKILHTNLSILNNKVIKKLLKGEILPSR